MAFLMIEIDESERDFTRFFWDENPGIDLENKRLDIFRMTKSLYVDDFLCGNVSVQAALTTYIESKQILEDASMDLRKWRTSSSELNERLKNLNFEVDEHKGSLNTLIASKVLGVGRLFDPGGRLQHSTLSEFQKHQMMLPKATNFKGARNILNEWNEICKSNRIQLFSAEEGIEWNFIPPASPHFGGLWDKQTLSP
ncbi:integrase catalytic domain-containing protein [Trichonephila clavipes]|nr:integrase catalytic domain-containing protein [Trichonephila clavipes]